MQLLDHKNPAYTVPETFFAQKIIELLHRKSIDTYRAMAMNPKTILLELRDLLADDRIVNSKAISYAIEETRLLLIGEDYDILNFNTVSKSFLLGLINAVENASDGVSKTKTREKARLAIDALILANNKSYGENLLQAIKDTLKAFDQNASEEVRHTYFERLQKVITQFVTELLLHGYSKRFLFRFFSTHFASRGSLKAGFEAGLEEVTALLSFPSKDYEVVFKIVLPIAVADESNFLEAEKIKLVYNLQDIEALIPAKLKLEQVRAFLNKIPDKTRFLRIEIQALDAFTALDKARSILAENLDLIHLGYSEESVSTDNQVLILERISATKHYFQVRTLHYEMDGDFRNGEDLYQWFSVCLSRITQSAAILKATKEKLKSAVRYLRLGNEALEIEHKFLNYWIGIEYLFAGIKDRSDINDIKVYFSHAHGNVYIKRLLNDFNSNLLRLKIANTLTHFKRNSTTHLTHKELYDEVIEKHSAEFPLLAHRASKIKKFLFPNITPLQGNKGGKNKMPLLLLEELINKHTKHLELHLARMYRIRNTILHNAAINMDIISITSNLRYYLTFILSAVIKELTENENLTSIEDFFLAQDLIFCSLKEERFPINKMLALNTPFDFVT